MNRQQFDSLDLNILRMLSANARTPYLEIARECGVSGAAVHQRIQRLTAAGVILGVYSKPCGRRLRDMRVCGILPARTG